MAPIRSHTRRWNSSPRGSTARSKRVRSPAKYSASWAVASSNPVPARGPNVSGSGRYQWCGKYTPVSLPSSATRVSSPSGESTVVWVAVISVLLVRVCCPVNGADPSNVRSVPGLIRAGGGGERGDAHVDQVGLLQARAVPGAGDHLGPGVRPGRAGLRAGDRRAGHTAVRVAGGVDGEHRPIPAKRGHVGVP